MMALSVLSKKDFNRDLVMQLAAHGVAMTSNEFYHMVSVHHKITRQGSLKALVRLEKWGILTRIGDDWFFTADFCQSVNDFQRLLKRKEPFLVR